MYSKYLIRCGSTGCENPVTHRCGYCGIPLCDAHKRTLVAEKGEEYFCGACYAYISVSGLGKRNIDRHLIPNILVVNSKKCTGCRSCELACSFEHFNEFSYELSAIRVHKIEERARNYPVVCLQCENPPCVEACPEDALVKSEENGLVVFHEDRCTLCEKCIEACPFVAIFLNRERNRIVKCDLCDGDPACVKACAPEALEWIKKYKFGERKKLVLNLNPYRRKK
jgi:carbon-monoxide dehydrogenase iron sulfur subunit